MTRQMERVPSGQRIGDGERERAAARLGEHVGAGRLGLPEFEERVRAVYAAGTRGDLEVLFADLPGTAPRPEPERERRGHRIATAAVWAPWLAVTVVCLGIWAVVSLAQGGPAYFWPVWVFGPWGAMLLVGTLTGVRACAAPRTPRGTGPAVSPRRSAAGPA